MSIISIAFALLSFQRVSATDWIMLNEVEADCQILSFDSYDTLTYGYIYKYTYSTNPLDSLVYQIKFVQTRDGGKSWDTTHFDSFTYKNLIPTDSIKAKDTISKDPTEFKRLVYADINTIYAFGSFGIIVKSSDKGKTWDTIQHRKIEYGQSPYYEFYRNGIGFIDLSIYPRTIYYSEDFGKTQYTVELPAEIKKNYLYSCFKRFGDSIYYLNGYDFSNWMRSLVWTNDKFKTINMFEGFQIVNGNFYFISPDEGYFLGWNSIYDHRVFIYKTIDGGFTWELLLKPTEQRDNFQRIVRINDQMLRVNGGTNHFVSHKNGTVWEFDSVNVNSERYPPVDYKIIGKRLYYVDMQRIYYLPLDQYVSAEEILPENSTLSVYPNPVLGSKFYIAESMNDLVSLELFSLNGSSVPISYIHTAFGTEVVLPDDISPGFYYLKILDSKGTNLRTGKIMIQR